MDHEQYHAAEGAFIDGFRAAADKQGFLALARIPLELPDSDGPSLKLVEVTLADSFEVGRASPALPRVSWSTTRCRASSSPRARGFPSAMSRSRARAS